LGQRLTDYALVALVILAVFGLFRLSRIVMNLVLRRIRSKHGELGPDLTLFVAFMFLLIGLLFLPSLTAVLAVINNHHLFGGLILHLVMVAISIVLFSIAEDMFREFPSIPGGREMWTVSEHFRRMAFPLTAFWAVGVIFLSPIFYSGLTLVLAIFYLYALSCRKAEEAATTGKKD
jgi:hypothetical protein